MTTTEFYRGTRVLVTGGDGFIGRALCRQLESLQARVFKMDNTFVPENTRALQDKYSADVSQIYSVREAFKSARPEVVFHLAAKTEVRSSFYDPLMFFRTNALGTCNILTVARERGVRHVIIASTDKVYGPNADAKETDPLVSSCVYSHTKRMADETAQAFAQIYGLPVTVLRPCNIYGPGQTNTTTLITNTICQILKGESPVIYEGSEHVVREWMFIDDIVDCYLLAGAHLPAKQSKAHVFNIGTLDRFSVQAVVGMILVALGRGAFEYIRKPATEPQIGNQGLNSYKFLYDVLGSLHTFTPFSEGLAKTINWMKDNQ